MISLVILEDHTLVRQSLVRLLSAEPDLRVAADVADGDAAVETIVRVRPDVAILDIGVPGRDGLEVAEEIRERAPEVRIIFLTMHEDQVSIRRAVQVGADGYLPKDASVEEMLTALHTVAGGSSYLSPGIARRVVRMAGQPAGPGLELTEREIEILRLLASGHRPVQIADELFLSVKTVKNHLTSVYSKLAVETAAQAVGEAFRRQLVGRHVLESPART